MSLRLSKDESRAVAFVGLLLAVSAVARLLDRPTPIAAELPSVDIEVLESASRRQQELETPLGPGEMLDPNKAPVEQIARLPGAGRTVAERVVTERSVRPFTSVADLQRVRGVGPATVEKWRPHLRLPETPRSSATPVATLPTGPGSDHATARLDLNRASATELERLPGIGPVLAARIVAYRDSVGRFGSIEQLEEVRGVGPAMMRRLAPQVRIGS